VADEKFVRVGGRVPMPARVHYVEPVYPPIAGQAVPRVMGIIILEVGLSEDGRPIDIKVLYGLPLLDEAAIEAVKQWRYQPTVIDGNAARVSFREVVDMFPDAKARVKYFADVVQNKKEQKTLRIISAERLRTTGERSKSILEALRKAAADPDSDISSAAARALQALEAP
jgi:protein TonB